MEIVHIALGGCLCPAPVPYGLTEDTGGHVAYVLGAAEAQARLPGVDAVSIVTRAFDDAALGARFARPRERVSPGCVIVRIGTADRAYLAKEALEAELPAFADALVAHLRALPRLPDVIHAHFADAAFVARRVRDALGVPYVYTAHSLGLDKCHAMGGDVPDALARRIASEDAAIAGAVAVIGSSRDECERQLLAYPSARAARIHKVPPGIHLPAAADPDEDWTWIDRFLADPSLPMVLAVARPVEKKNLAGLVGMFGADPALRARANLVIVAGLRDGVDGPGEVARVHRGLLAAIDRHDLHGHVAYPRRHDQRQVGALYRRAAASGGLFANPALTEPFGLTIQEAAAHGLPVVATCHGGPADILRDLGHGVTADPLDPAAFAAAMRELLADEPRRSAMARTGQARAMASGWNRYAERSLRVLRGAVAPARPRPAARRLVVCDIDGTLTGSREGAAAFAAWRAGAGDVHFAVATGRSLPEARAVLADWDLPEPDTFVTCVGTEIHRRDRHGALTFDDAFHEAAIAPWPREAVRSLLAATPAARLLRPQPEVEQRAGKLSYHGDVDAARHAHRALAKAGLASKVVLSHGDLLDVLPPRAGKGAATRHLLGVLGLPDAACTCFGDSGNDLDFVDAGLPTVFVANHAPELDRHRARANVRVAPLPHAAGVVSVLAGSRAAARVHA